MLPSTLKYLCSVETVIMHFPAKQPYTNDAMCNAAICCIAALHTVSFVHGKVHSEWFKVDGSVEKKWDTVIPADLKTLFFKWDITYTRVCPAGHERVNPRWVHHTQTPRLAHSYVPEGSTQIGFCASRNWL